jgi:hypothetical protein
MGLNAEYAFKSFITDESADVVYYMYHKPCYNRTLYVKSIITLPILMPQMHISTTQVSSVMLRSKKLEIRKKCENCKSCPMKTKQSAMKLSQIRRRIDLRWGTAERDNPSFWDEFIKL